MQEECGAVLTTCNGILAWVECMVPVWVQLNSENEALYCSLLWFHCEIAVFVS